MRAKVSHKGGRRLAARHSRHHKWHGTVVWTRVILTRPLSSAIALAMVVFAAGSAIAMTSVASADIAMANYVSMPQHQTSPRVLGVSTLTIDDSALEAADPSGSISAKPGSFDVSIGRWNYTLAYKVANLQNSATVSIGTFAVKSDITQPGSVQTGAILKPNMTYRATLWVTDGSGARQVLARLEFKTRGPKNSDITLPPCAVSQAAEGSSTSPSMCVKTATGEIKCAQPLCLPQLRQQNGSDASGTVQFMPMLKDMMPRQEHQGQGPKIDVSD